MSRRTARTQDALRATFNERRVRPSREQSHLAQHAGAERIVRQNLQVLRRKRDEYDAAFPDEAERSTAVARVLYEVVDAQIAQELAALSDALAGQGHFGRAAELDPRDDQAAWLLRIAEAVERDDSETCPCEKTKVVGSLRVPVERIEAESTRARTTR
jgi:hypothetical protein